MAFAASLTRGRSASDGFTAHAGSTRINRKEHDVNSKTITTSPMVHRWRAFGVLAVAYFMTVVDLTIVNTALPTIGRDLHFSATNLQWVATAYALTFGGFLLLGGRAADLLGRRRVLMAGLGVFSAASLACALATGDGFLIGARAVQGIGAAVMLPAALSIVMNMFEEGTQRNKALGIWGALAASGATVGLVAGGLLTRYVSWQYIFYLNVPIAVAALLLAPRIVPESRLITTRRRFDAFGGLAASVASVALAGLSQYLVTRIGSKVVMAIGMTLIGAGVLWATQVPVHGHYIDNLLGPFAVAGAGTAFAFIPISIAGLAGVEEYRAGLAAGLLNTSQQLGGAIGIAIASSVAASHTKALLDAGHAVPAALTGGFQHALWALGAIALIALPAIFALVRRSELSDARRKTPMHEPQLAPASAN